MKLKQFNSLSKIRFHHEWIESYRQGKAVPPISVEMDLTNRCNYGCPNCVWGEYIGTNQAHVPFENALQQVRDCAEAGIKAVIFSGGGEPLLNPATPHAIRLAKELGLSVGIFTHGQLLDEKSTQTLVECCDFARIHLDGATPDTYVRRHKLRALNLERVRQNLIRLNGMARDRNSSIEVGIGAVINHDNYNDLTLLAEFAYDTGCRYLQVKHDFELLSQTSYTEWWDNEVVPVLVQLETRYQPTHFRIQYTTTDYTRAPQARTCHIHHLATAINADGEFSYCKRLRDKPEWSAGNVRNERVASIISGTQNRTLSEQITPQNCGINCPYLELNDYIDEMLKGNEEFSPPEHQELKHPNFF